VLLRLLEERDVARIDDRFNRNGGVRQRPGARRGTRSGRRPRARAFAAAAVAWRGPRRRGAGRVGECAPERRGELESSTRAADSAGTDATGLARNSMSTARSCVCGAKGIGLTRHATFPVAALNAVYDLWHGGSCCSTTMIPLPMLEG
jgi:hypothetical protein